MPYCGTQWVPVGTTTCPSGGKPTAVPAGMSGSGQPSGQPTLTVPEPTPLWNQDTTPVQLGSERKYLGTELSDVPRMSNVTEARNYFNQIWGAGTAKDATAAEKANLRNFVAGLRAYSDSELGTRGSIENEWANLLKDASRAGVDAFSLLGQRNPFLEDGETGSGPGRGGYSGPVAQTTFMDERDVDRTANALALTLIGRPLSAKEMAKVTERLRSEEKANPTVTTPGVGSSVTQSGLSAEGRADVLREVIAENPEYQQFQVDTTVLDTMLSELNKREQMVNGR